MSQSSRIRCTHSVAGSAIAGRICRLDSPFILCQRLHLSVYIRDSYFRHLQAIKTAAVSNNTLKCGSGGGEPKRVFRGKLQYGIGINILYSNKYKTYNSIWAFSPIGKYTSYLEFSVHVPQTRVSTNVHAFRRTLHSHCLSVWDNRYSELCLDYLNRPNNLQSVE